MPPMTTIPFSRPTPFRWSGLSKHLHPLKQRPRMLFALLHTQANPELPTFHYQNSLPRLPLPPLRQTLDRYLQTLEPFFALKQENGGESISSARTKRREWARQFEDDLGAKCQERLQELQNSAPYNWLDDSFWLKKAYLETRSSLLVNSNWWLALQDDVQVPGPVRLSPNPPPFNDWQLRRAAWVIKRMLHFKKRIDQQTLPPDITRTAPLCMSHYKRMFNMTRIPKQGCDILHKAHEGDPSSQQITLLVNGHMFLVDVYDTSGDICSLDTLVQRLRACTLEAQCEVTPVAILTADDREIWAKNRDHLASLSPSNGQNLSSVDSSLFCLSLDSTRTRIKHGDSIYSSEDLTNARWDDHLHNTAYGMDGFNRWFDKTITLSVESNTRLGMMGEHSPCDALIPSILGDYCVEEPMHLAEFEPSNFTSESIPGWRRLDWQLDHHITAECQRVAQEAKSIVDDSDDSQLWFQDYGVSWIRGTAKLSPDAFLQMALQLAWLKDQKKPTAIYETASTRIFLHGRTEVIRSFSKESLAFVRAMNDETATQGERLQFLITAIKAHNTFTRDASLGKGVDRHLMALRLVMSPDERAKIFEDEMFSQSQEWKLSTSGLSSGDRFIGTGFGTPYPDGYGINYLAGPSILKFGIESKHSCKTTSTQAFKRALVQSLREIRSMCEEGYFELSNEIKMEEQAQARL